MTFATLEQAEDFIRTLLRGQQGKPLLALAAGPHGEVVVSGTWEDPLGGPAAVIEDNRMIASKSPGLRLSVEDRAVTCTLDGEMLWQVRMDRGGVTLEGIFFTGQGMVAVTPWGFVGWTALDAFRLLEEAADPDPDDLPGLPPGDRLPVLPSRVH